MWWSRRHLCSGDRSLGYQAERRFRKDAGDLGSDPGRRHGISEQGIQDRRRRSRGPCRTAVVPWQMDLNRIYHRRVRFGPCGLHRHDGNRKSQRAHDGSRKTRSAGGPFGCFQRRVGYRDHGGRPRDLSALPAITLLPNRWRPSKTYSTPLSASASAARS